jgi:hypothetical protein
MAATAEPWHTPVIEEHRISAVAANGRSYSGAGGQLRGTGVRRESAVAAMDSSCRARRDVHASAAHANHPCSIQSSPPPASR